VVTALLSKPRVCCATTFPHSCNLAPRIWRNGRGVGARQSGGYGCGSHQFGAHRPPPIPATLRPECAGMEGRLVPGNLVDNYGSGSHQLAAHQTFHSCNFALRMYRNGERVGARQSGGDGSGSHQFAEHRRTPVIPVRTARPARPPGTWPSPASRPGLWLWFGPAGASGIIP
jgi:hypothetical protein